MAADLMADDPRRAAALEELAKLGALTVPTVQRPTCTKRRYTRGGVDRALYLARMGKQHRATSRFCDGCEAWHLEP